LSTKYSIHHELAEVGLDHACLTYEYMHGRATLCTESTQISSAKNLFFADENEIRFIWAVIRSAVLYST